MFDELPEGEPDPASPSFASGPGEVTAYDPAPTLPSFASGPGEVTVYDPAPTLPFDPGPDRLDGPESRPGWSLWDEALLLVTQELDEGDDEAEPLPDSLFASLIAWMPE